MLEYLLANSPIARELESPTLEELLTPLCKTPERMKKATELLALMPQFATDKFRPDYCYSGVYPYDSITRISTEDLLFMCILADYFDLPCNRKLSETLENGTNISNYKVKIDGKLVSFDPDNVLHWISAGSFVLDQLWRFESDEPETSKYCKYAAAAGQLELLQQLSKNPIHTTYDVCSEAARWNQLECLQYGYNNRFMFDHRECCLSAAEGGSIECLEWLATFEPLYDTRKHDDWYEPGLLGKAAKSGYVECLKWLHDHVDTSTICYEFAICCAAEGGNIDCVNFIYKKADKDKITGCFMSTAAEKGYLHILQYGYDNKCSFGGMTISLASQNGHFEIVKWLHEHGCPWDSHLCQFTASYGHIDCLRYAIENGCPVPDDLCIYAAQSSNLECLKYVHNLIGMSAINITILDHARTPETRRYVIDLLKEQILS